MGIYKSLFSCFLVVFFYTPLGMSALNNHDKLPDFTSIHNHSIPQEVINVTKEKLHQSLKRYRFNGTALIAYGDQIIFEEARGIANFSTREPLNISSSFQLASVSKPFTALSIMILKERKLLDYDDKVSRIIDDFPYPDITIRHLLSHTSGLQNYMYLVDHYWDNDSILNNQKMLQLLVNHELPLNNIPGRRFEYSNTGYAVLALIVEKVAGQKFGDFLKKELFDKLGMKNSFVYDRQFLESDSTQVLGYNNSGRRRRQYFHDANNEVLGDKSIYSTVHDLLKFTTALNNFEIVDKETLDEAYSKAVLRNSRSVNYGFGWRIKEDGKRKYIFHNGAWHGFTSTITLEPNNKITLLLLNNTNASIATIKNDLLYILHSEFDSYLN